MKARACAYDPVKRRFRANDVSLGNRLLELRSLHIEIAANRGFDSALQREDYARRRFSSERNDP